MKWVSQCAGVQTEERTVEKANIEALDPTSALFSEWAVWLDSQYCPSCCVKAVLAA